MSTSKNVPKEEGQSLADEHIFFFLETSVEENENIEELMLSVVSLAREKKSATSAGSGDSKCVIS
jgi:hypothetical protein